MIMHSIDNVNFVIGEVFDVNVAKLNQLFS